MRCRRRRQRKQRQRAMHSSEATLDSPMRRTDTSRGPAGLNLFAAATAAVLAGAVLMHAATQPPTSPAPAARPRPVAPPGSSDALPHVEARRITAMVVEFPPGALS